MHKLIMYVFPDKLDNKNKFCSLHKIHKNSQKFVPQNKSSLENWISRKNFNCNKPN